MESRRPYSKCRALTRSFAVCKRGQPEQINSLTSFIEASQVYGSSTEEAERVCSKCGGKMNLLRLLLK